MVTTKRFQEDRWDGNGQTNHGIENNTQPSTSSSGEWQRTVASPMDISEDKKQQALGACADVHEALLTCLKKGGIFANCNESQKAFWDCYAEHRGIRGNKIAAWFAPAEVSVQKVTS